MHISSLGTTDPIQMGGKAANPNRAKMASSGFHQRNQFDDIAEQYGFSAFAVLGTHQSHHGRIQPQLLLNNLDSNITDRIEATDELEKSSRFDRLSVSNVPFGWKFATNGETKEKTPLSALEEMFVALDLNCGYCIPVYSASSRRHVVTYFADQIDVSAQFPELVLDTMECFQNTFGNDLSDRTDAGLLNDSERNCLLWAAQGKTSNEIALTLALSEHTVNHYFSIAAAKLGANNRTHAIAMAIQMGLIDIGDQQRKRLN